MTAYPNAGGGFPAVPPRRHKTLRAVLPWIAFALFVVGFLTARLRDTRTDSGYPPWLPGAGAEVPDYVRENFLTVNKYSRPGDYLRKIDGVVIHYVGNPGSTANANRNYFESLSDGRLGVYASSHFIVGLEGETVQCVPLTEIAYASNNRNRDTVSIEVCHPDAGGKFNDATYQRVVELSGWLCRTFDLDPSQDVIRHYDVSGKLCPLYYVEHPEAWEALRGDIAAVKARPAAEGE
ncbi:MAG: N-acetylmuramoyl-L-alanine amidase [Oscillibacter sp.]|nr:N-acetylmuramoyl-L-alanine amidase [Oscillibacter sp.]